LNEYLPTGKVQILVSDGYGLTSPNSCSHQERYAKECCRLDRPYEVNIGAAKCRKSGLA